MILYNLNRNFVTATLKTVRDLLNSKSNINNIELKEEN